MSTTLDPRAATVTAPARPAADPDDEPWPVCRCGHPTHPHKLERRRGVMMERFVCPRRRWWNTWFHPAYWRAPRD